MIELGWLTVLVFVIYAPCLRGAFVFDDLSTINANAEILQGRTRHWWKSWRGPGRALHALQVRLLNPAVVANPGRVAPDTYSFHIVNVVLHVVNSALVGAFFQGLGLDSLSSLIGALIYAVHPLASSAVSYVTAQSAVLSATFGLLALTAIVSGWTLAAIPLLGLAVLSKEDAAILPFPSALLAWMSGSAVWWIFLVIPPLFALRYFKEFVRLWKHNGDVHMRQAGLETSSRFSIHALTVIGEHLLRYPQWVVGLGQNPDPHIAPWTWTGRRTWTALGIGLNLVALALLVPQLRLPFALILLSPMSIYPFIPLPDPVFEHRSYFSILGIALGFALFLTSAPFWVTPLVVAFFASIAAYRAMLHHNWLDFWAWALESGSARKARCLQNMAAFYKLNQMPEVARQYLRLAITVNPKSASSLCDLADLDARAGNLDGAKRWLEQAVDRCPEFAQAWFGLGRVYQHMNQPNESQQAFRRHAELAAKG